jgi:general secretion pathway protein K
MLLVLVGLVILGMVANEVRYNSVVELRLAANQRDELRAHFLAKSGIGLSRLLLRFQKQMDSLPIPNFGDIVRKFTEAAGGAGGTAGGLPGAAGAAAGLPGGLAPAPSTMSIQLWRMAKVDCYMLQQMVPPEEEKKSGLGRKTPSRLKFDEDEPQAGQAQQQKRFGTFTGCFNTTITDEEERINLNKLDAPQLTAVVLLNQLITALGDKKYEFLFEKEDAHRVKVAPNDVIIGLRDWIDEDETGSQLNFSGQGEPFIKGFSDENGNYDGRYDPRYRAKNGRFDSLDELYMVHGVNDRFMAAFKDKLTVYPDVNSRLNINTDDPILLELAIRTVADPIRPDPRLGDPVFVDTLVKKIRAARMFALFGMSAADFVNIVASSGVAVNQTILNNVQNQRFIGDKSSTYRVAVTGTAGDVTRTITAVVRLDDGLGRLVYWREE